ncbi:MAG: division/cell wall cluster transcriptional repressor MraZ [Pedobacter agri]|uniref:Transcriptional regulator MraZ n=1 Tax=Pedobacter agri TaxID=454586 RepID=A0A9X3I843_9SPHI|nr:MULTISPECIES: division/cell wall cluster transcriptional repressor MraZ [Pedobacter]AZI25878.1 division/cell wall cluster transcriptional repressor MraZ [Pedobacter sp. G11]MCX3263609.1 division/cell wall cluster transcriptional repressor MraZ [Pedobacter agri]MDQ1141917.1 MraZ protein [Pedobacter agri]RYF26269.1 MAG: division/cell wall cluster transcriptional repressor MraZ [Flavobacteriales bacterium]
MTQLLGEFDCKLDAKGRLMVPAALKKQLPNAENEGLIINRGFEKNLVIYPKNVWDAVVADLAKLNIYDEENRRFVRAFTRGATEISLDAAGRVLLPKSLTEYAGIASDLVLACQLDRIEVWDKKSYEDIFDDVPENFANLAQKVMGSKKGGADGE